MAADAELGVMLEPTNDLEDEVGDVQAGVGSAGGGGDLSAGQQQQQEGIVAGGVSKGIAGAAVLVGILTQVKSVVGIVEAVFGVISRSLIPVIEKVADFIRPLVSRINELAGAPEEAAQVVQTQQRGQLIGQLGGPQGQLATSALQVAEEFDVGNDNTQQIVDAATNFLGLGGPDSADTTGEAQKQSFLQTLEDGKRDKTGASK